MKIIKPQTYQYVYDLGLAYTMILYCSHTEIEIHLSIELWTVWVVLHSYAIFNNPVP